MGRGGIFPFAQALKTNNTLIRLELRQNDIGDYGAAILGVMLKVNNTLQSLFLDQNDITDKG